MTRAMPPIFVISLKDSAARRAGLLDRLDGMGLQATVFDAVDGRAGLPERYHSKIDRAGCRERIFREPSDAEFACALSHNTLYEQIAAGADRYAIILEDDAILTDRFRDVVAALETLDLDLLLLDHQKTFASTESILVADGITARRVMLSPELTTGYAISRRMAAHMATATLPIRGTADWPLEIENHRTFATIPRVVDHPEDEAVSQIQSSRGETVATGRWRRLLRAGYWRKKYRKARYERIA